MQKSLYKFIHSQKASKPRQTVNHSSLRLNNTKASHLGLTLGCFPIVLADLTIDLAVVIGTLQTYRLEKWWLQAHRSKGFLGLIPTPHLFFLLPFRFKKLTTLVTWPGKIQDFCWGTVFWRKRYSFLLKYQRPLHGRRRVTKIFINRNWKLGC